MQRLWEAGATGATGGKELSSEAAGRLSARVAYGIGAAWGGRGVLTPYTDVSLSGEGSRRLSLGGRLDIGPSAGMSLEGAHSRSARGTARPQCHAARQPALVGMTIKRRERELDGD